VSSGRPDVVVVGAGVIGMTTAVCLAEAGMLVVIRSAEAPRDTTSAAAGALCGPTITGPEDSRTGWGLVSDAEFAVLAAQPETGVRLMRGRLVSRIGQAAPAWALRVPGYLRCPAEQMPSGFSVGFWVRIPAADMPRYLDYLFGRFLAAGGRLELGTLNNLAEAAALAPVVVNCSGAYARDLAADANVHPVLGQHVILENPGLDTFLHEYDAPSAWTAFLPHGERVLLGGVAVENGWQRGSDPQVTRQILTRCIEVEPRLAGARILGVQIGLRPARATVRLEEEPFTGARCIHNYGHGGSGVSLSWGCARTVLGMITGESEADPGLGP